MLILCKSEIGEADFDRLGKVLAALPYPMRWSRRRGRLAILLDRANSAQPELAPLLADPAIDYVLRAPSEDEIGRVFSRRDLLHFSLASTGVLAGAVLMAPVGLYLAAPAGERTAEGDTLVAPAEGKHSIPVDGTRAKIIDGEEFLVVRREADRYNAVSRTCTHSGVCLVDWESKRQQFVCPCHSGVYDVYGNVVSGPPPRPLKSRVVEVKDGQVYVKKERPS